MSKSDNMQNHLISQFQGKKVIRSLLDVWGNDMDELEKVFLDLKNKRWIDSGDGVQLDGVGEIVVQSRQISEAVQLSFFGFEGQPNALTFSEGRFRETNETHLQTVNLADPEYRTVLWAKVSKNTSFGYGDDTIRSLKFIFNAKIVLHEMGNAKIAVAIGRRLTPNEITMANAIDLLVRAGGVGIAYLSMFEYDNYFGFLGQQNAKGFDTGAFADGF